jgi:hypothetical protein
MYNSGVVVSARAIGTMKTRIRLIEKPTVQRYLPPIAAYAPILNLNQHVQPEKTDLVFPATTQHITFILERGAVQEAQAYGANVGEEVLRD